MYLFKGRGKLALLSTSRIRSLKEWILFVSIVMSWLCPKQLRVTPGAPITLEMLISNSGAIGVILERTTLYKIFVHKFIYLCYSGAFLFDLNWKN